MFSTKLEHVSWVLGMEGNKTEEGKENISCGENHGNRVETSGVNPLRHCGSIGHHIGKTIICVGKAPS